LDRQLGEIRQRRRRLSLTIVLTRGRSRPRSRVARTVTFNLAASASPLRRNER
jgi:hypothetical protein